MQWAPAILHIVTVLKLDSMDLKMPRLPASDEKLKNTALDLAVSVSTIISSPVPQVVMTMILSPGFTFWPSFGPFFHSALSTKNSSGKG